VTTRDPLNDEALARLLAARRAAADPATRARAIERVRGGLRSPGALEPAWLAWLERPAALATAASLLVVSLGAGVWFAERPSSGVTTAATTTTDLIGSLLTDESGTDAVIGGAGLDSGSAP
jgi:anti-sigma factor RsiW